MKVEFSQSLKLGVLCVYAVRYALKQRTYAPGMAIASVMDIISQIDTEDLETMLNDIDKRLRIGPISPYDEKLWLYLLDALGDELEKRQKNKEVAG